MRKTALVTGGARGIGKAIVADLAHDHNVAFTWLSTPPAADQTTADHLLALHADLTDPAAVARVIDSVTARFDRLDVLVNNAGLVTPSAPEALDLPAVTRMLEINLLAAHTLLTAALPHLGAGASIVNISSVNAVLPPRGAALFGASKAALDLWTRGMAKELGSRGIRVNAVAPGAVDIPDALRPDALRALFLDQTALGRLATPQDVAHAVRFLAGEDASFITGEVLTVSGGYRL